MHNQELIDLGKEYQLAKSKYEQAVRSIVRNSTTMQNKTLFWKMIDDLAYFIDKSVPNRDDPVRYGIQNWLREIELNNCEGYDNEDIPSFIATYSKLREHLAKQLLSIDMNLTNIVDALPLAGKKVCLIVLAGQVSSLNQLQSVVRSEDRLQIQILIKENRVLQWLEQAYSDRLCSDLTILS